MPQLTICQACGKPVLHAPGFCVLCGEVLNPSFFTIQTVTPKKDMEVEQELVAA